MVCYTYIVSYISQVSFLEIESLGSIIILSKNPLNRAPCSLYGNSREA